MAAAFVMVRPTPVQAAAIAAGHGLRIIGAHRVGVADGGPGLPVFGWSTVTSPGAPSPGSAASRKRSPGWEHFEGHRFDLVGQRPDPRQIDGKLAVVSVSKAYNGPIRLERRILFCVGG